MNESSSLKPYSAALAFGFFNATTWMIALGTPLVLLAGQLGATTFQVGLLYSFFFLLLPVQVISTVLLPRFGYKAQLVFGWTGRAVFLLIPLGLAWMSPPEAQPWMMHALIVSAFGFAFFRAMGSCGIMPWLYDLVPESMRGRFFATDQSLAATAGLLTLLFCALTFAVLPTYTAFTFQYGFALLGSVVTIYFILRIPSVPNPHETSVAAIVRDAPKLCTEAGGFRQYLFFIIIFNTVATVVSPFTVYYLQVEVGMTSERVLLYAAAHYLGTIIGSILMRMRIDKFGVKPVFRLALVLNLAVCLYWIALVSGLDLLTTVLPLAFFVFGFASSNWAIANLKYLPRICPEDDRALAVAVHSSVVGLMGGLAPMFWGFFIKRSDAATGMNHTAFAIYFAIAFVLQVALLAYVGRLTSSKRELPSIPIGDYGFRPFRYLSALINLIPARRDRR